MYSAGMGGLLSWYYHRFQLVHVLQHVCSHSHSCELPSQTMVIDSIGVFSDHPNPWSTCLLINTFMSLAGRLDRILRQRRNPSSTCRVGITRIFPPGPCSQHHTSAPQLCQTHWPRQALASSWVAGQVVFLRTCPNCGQPTRRCTDVN